MNTPKLCILDDEKLCIECHECDRCDLDPDKICDDCMRCVQSENVDYAGVIIDEILGEGED